MTNKQTDTILNVLHLIPEHILIQQILVLESTDLTYYIASAKHTVSSLLQRKFKGIQQAYFAQHLQELKQLTQEELIIRLTALLQEKLNLSTPNKNEITKALAHEAAKLYPHIASRTISDNYKLDLIAQQFAIDSREKLRKQNNEEARHTEQLIDNYLTAMSDEDKLQLFHTFKPDVLNGAGIRKALIATGIPLGLQSLSSFGMYYAPATILHAVFTTALGITLPFVVYTSTVTLMSVLTGPTRVIESKIHNQIVILRRQSRYKKDVDISKSLSILQRFKDHASACSSNEKLIGYEGIASKTYFQALGQLMPEIFIFTERSKRPPRDPVNTLLSFGYTILYNELLAIILSEGLHPYVGFLHKIRDRHPSLVSDLIEEWRAPLIDSLVLNLIKKQIIPDMFTSNEKGCFLLKGGRKLFLEAYHAKLMTTNTYTGQERTFRNALRKQCRDYASAVVHEDLTLYTPIHFR